MDDLQVDHAADEPPFEQLRRHLALQVREGTLEPGERLPTVRGLAAQVGLAVTTVARVYRELETDGVVVTEGRRGTFVAADRPSADAEAAAATYAAAARRAGLGRAEAIRALERAW